MKKKILGILICIIFIFAALVPITGSLSLNKTKTNSPGVIDQSQNLITTPDWLEGGVPHYQEFVNKGNILEEIQLHMGCYFGGSYDMTISIEKPLSNKLCFVTLNAAMFPNNMMDWMTINLPDIQLNRNQNYFIVVQFDPGSEYAWSGDNTDPYPAGGSSNPDPNWDYAFRTIVDKSRNKDYEPKPITDQSQEKCDECAFIPNYAYQSFVPQEKKLLQIDVCIAQWYGGSPDLKVSIERPLGTALTSASLTAAQVPSGSCDWVTFDLNPDIQLQKGETYFIVLSYPPGGEYGWCGAYGDLYSKGTSDKHPDWDYCFRTIVDKSKPRIQFLDIFLEMINNYPMLRLFLKI